MTDVEIRRALPADWRFVRQARLATLLDAPEAFGSRYEDEAEHDEPRWKHRVERNAWFVAVEEPSGRAVGCVRHAVDDRAPAGDHDLASLWVAPAHRGSGLVDRLVEAVAEQTRSTGGHRVTLWVKRSNTRAIAAYERLGFVEVPVPSALAHHECAGEIRMARHVRSRADVVVRHLADADEWETLRDVRLGALASDPDAFYSTYAREAADDDERWRERAAEGVFRLALDASTGQVLGLIGVVDEPGAPPGGRHLISMWVSPAARGRGVAGALVRAVADAALAEGAQRLTLWVKTDNDAARTAYAGMGFAEQDPPPGVQDYRSEGEVRLELDLTSASAPSA